MTPRRELTIRSPEDLLACLPLVLGFVPERSVVMLSLTTPHGPHARADLVPPEEVEHLGDSLAAAARGNGVDRVALAILDDDLDGADLVAQGLMRAFRTAQVDVAALVAADGTRWRSLGPGASGVPQTYDALHHPLVLREIVEGRVVHRTREDVRAQLGPDPVRAREVAEARRGAPTSGSDGPEWVEEFLTDKVGVRVALSPTEVARLLDAVDDPDNRDAAWCWVAKDDARKHLELWLEVVRSCAMEEAGPAASLLAFHAWLVGEGALAWCAIEHAEESGGTTLSVLVSDLLERAAPPMMWTPLRSPRQAGSCEGVA